MGLRQKGSTWHFAFLNFMQLLSDHWSNLSTSFYRHFQLSSSRLTLLPKLGVIWKLTEDALHPIVQLIGKDLKQDWPQHWPLGSTSGDQPPAEFTTTLWAQTSREFSIPWTVHSPKPWAANSSGRIMWRLVLEVLLKSWQAISTAFLSSTN